MAQCLRVINMKTLSQFKRQELSKLKLKSKEIAKDYYNELDFDSETYAYFLFLVQEVGELFDNEVWIKSKSKREHEYFIKVHLKRFMKKVRPVMKGWY